MAVLPLKHLLGKVDMPNSKQLPCKRNNTAILNFTVKLTSIEPIYKTKIGFYITEVNGRVIIFHGRTDIK